MPPHLWLVSHMGMCGYATLSPVQVDCCSLVRGEKGPDKLSYIFCASSTKCVWLFAKVAPPVQCYQWAAVAVRRLGILWQTCSGRRREVGPCSPLCRLGNGIHKAGKFLVQRARAYGSCLELGVVSPCARYFLIGGRLSPLRELLIRDARNRDG